MCTFVWGSVCVCGGQRLTSDIVAQTLSTLLSETGSFTGLELTSQERPAGLWASGLFLFWPPQCWDHKPSTSHPAFVHGFQGSISVPHRLAQQTLYQLNYLPSPWVRSTFNTRHCSLTHARNLRKQAHTLFSVELCGCTPAELLAWLHQWQSY